MSKDHLPRYTRCVDEVLRSAEGLHDAFYMAETFHGPSLYFHQRSIALASAGLTTQRLEYIYATLSAWGMHRMGKGGSKMVPFGDFEQSVGCVRDAIAEVSRIDVDQMNPQTWDSLERVFRGINVMATETRLVGNSKVMAHLLPHLVPPIDREYTLRYLRGSTNITNDCDKEWATMRQMLEGFFYAVAKDARFKALADQWMNDRIRFPWDTSPMKIVDNLVIGAVKTASII